MKLLLIKLLVTSSLAALLSSCATYRSDFGGGYHALESTYLDKPHYDSLPQSAWYASVRAIRASGYNISPFSPQEGDRNQVYEAVVHRGTPTATLVGPGGSLVTTATTGWVTDTIACWWITFFPESLTTVSGAS